MFTLSGVKGFLNGVGKVFTSVGGRECVSLQSLRRKGNTAKRNLVSTNSSESTRKLVNNYFAERFATLPFVTRHLYTATCQEFIGVVYLSSHSLRLDYTDDNNI